MSKRGFNSNPIFPPDYKPDLGATSTNFAQVTVNQTMVQHYGDRTKPTSAQLKRFHQHNKRCEGRWRKLGQGGGVVGIRNKIVLFSFFPVFSPLDLHITKHNTFANSSVICSFKLALSKHHIREWLLPQTQYFPQLQHESFHLILLIMTQALPYVMYKRVMCLFLALPTNRVVLAQLLLGWGLLLRPQPQAFSGNAVTMAEQVGQLPQLDNLQGCIFG